LEPTRGAGNTSRIDAIAFLLLGEVGRMLIRFAGRKV